MDYTKSGIGWIRKEDCEPFFFSSMVTSGSKNTLRLLKKKLNFLLK